MANKEQKGQRDKKTPSNKSKSKAAKGAVTALGTGDGTASAPVVTQVLERGKKRQS